MTRDIKTETGSYGLGVKRGRELVLIILLCLFLVRESGSLFAGHRAQGGGLQGEQEAKKVEVETKPPTGYMTFAQLRYVSASGNAGLVDARDLLKIQIIESERGDEYWLELFFHHADYVFSKITELTMYQTVSKIQKAKVQLVRVPRGKIGFPLVLGR